MFHHLRAILLASATLVGLGMTRGVSAEVLRNVPSVAVVAIMAPSQQIQSARVRALTSASVRAIAIGY
jgi:hypothetical protein